MKQLHRSGVTQQANCVLRQSSKQATYQMNYLEFSMDTIMEIVYPRVNMTSFLLQESMVKLRMSVNMDTICMYLGYNWLITQKTLSINASFVNNKQWLQVMMLPSTLTTLSFLSYLPIYLPTFVFSYNIPLSTNLPYL